MKNSDDSPTAAAPEPGAGAPAADLMVPLASVPEGTGLVVRVHPRLRVAIFRVGEAIHAIDDRCPHAGASLGEGALAGAVVTCPLHGFMVDVTTGQCPHNPLLRVRRFETRREGDALRVLIPAST